MRALWRIALLLLIFGLSSRFYYSITDDFRIAHITDELPYRSEYEISPLEETEMQEVLGFLRGPFRYLGKGGQAFAFQSRDGKYVLKLFSYKLRRPSFLSQVMPSIGPLKEMKEKHFTSVYHKYHAPFQGYKLAFEKHREGCGLLYVHLNRTNALLGSVEVKDKLGFSHRISLDDHAFVLQRKGENFATIVTRQLETGDLVAAKKAIQEMLAFFSWEEEKGFYDRDRSVMQNTGFIQGKPARIDPGQLVELSSEKIEPSHVAIGKKKIMDFVQENYPEYAKKLLR